MPLVQCLCGTHGCHVLRPCLRLLEHHLPARAKGTERISCMMHPWKYIVCMPIRSASLSTQPAAALTRVPMLPGCSAGAHCTTRGFLWSWSPSGLQLAKRNRCQGSSEADLHGDCSVHVPGNRLPHNEPISTGLRFQHRFGPLFSRCHGSR